MIELRQNNSTLYLHFYYLKDIKEGPIVLHLPICSNDTESGCPVKKFVESVNDLLINDWTEECREKQYILDSNTGINPITVIDNSSLILITSDSLYDWFAANDVCYDFGLHIIHIFSTEEQRNSISYVTYSIGESIILFPTVINIFLQFIYIFFISDRSGKQFETSTGFSLIFFISETAIIGYTQLADNCFTRVVNGCNESKSFSRLAANLSVIIHLIE